MVMLSIHVARLRTFVLLGRDLALQQLAFHQAVVRKVKKNCNLDIKLLIWPFGGRKALRHLQTTSNF